MDILTMKSKVYLGCNLCQKCCINRGDIRITPFDALRIAKYLKISLDEFLYKYTKKITENSFEVVLKVSGKKDQCILYDNKCTIHKVKPMQCIMFPLVPENIKRDYFINNEQCEYKPEKPITVNEWLNGNNNLYKKNKNNTLIWVYFLEDTESIVKSLPQDKVDELFKRLFLEYDLDKPFNKIRIKRRIKQIKNELFEIKKELKV